MRTHQLSPAPVMPRRPRRVWRNTEPARVPPDPAGFAELELALATFSTVRSRLFGIAYRMLGSVADAEDIVQDAWLRWQSCDRTKVREPAAFLATTTTRLALNMLQSARMRHETYVGPWLPEPIDTGANPELTVERDETLEIGVLFLLERLTPAERAAYVLREAFGYPYDQIAAVVDTSEASARQLVSRARKHLAREKHPHVDPSQQRTFLQSFLRAAQSGDLAGLESLLAADVVSYSDGGEVVHAARIALIGRKRVAKFVRAISEWFWEGVHVEWIEANGLPAVLLSAHGEPFALFSVTATAEGIDRLFWMMNPEKLGGVISHGRAAA